MAQPFVPRVGGILSADIAVPEHDREVRFYARVLTTGDDPLWRDDLMNNAGLPIIGLGERTEETANLPLQWMPHIQVADVTASVTRALELGGRELMHSRDAEGNSQWAVLLDPNGAAFGIIPVVTPDAMPPTEETVSGNAVRVGRIAWVNLTVSDAAITRDFYQQVIGWSVHEVEMEHAGDRYFDFGMADSEGEPAAGVCHARGTNGDLPPVWLIYLPVGDLDESLRRVEEEGGEVLRAARGSDAGFAYAVVRDLVGACFALIPG